MPTVEFAHIFGDRLNGAVDNNVTNSCMVCRTTTDCKTVKYQELVCTTWKTYKSCAQNIAQGRLNPYLTTAEKCTSGGCYLASEAGAREPTTDIGPCVGDPNEPGLKDGSVKWCPWVPATNWTKQDPITGPNINCPTPILGLSGNRKQVLETIDRMTPVPGGTHGDVGLRWGLRTLSPNSGWPAFFGLDKPPVQFSGRERKVMVLITDGENSQAIDYPGYWDCKGYQNPGCKGSPDKAELDRMMKAWCTAIRTQYNVDLYAVAVNFTNKQAVQLVNDCAPEPGRFFNIDAAELKRVLNVIAGSVIKLRITS